MKKILLLITNKNGTVAQVYGEHYMPETLEQEIIDQNVLVDTVLKFEQQVGKNAIHYVDLNTLKQWVEYEDRPLTQEEQQITVLADALTEATLFMAKQEEQLNLQNDAISELTMLVASLQTT